MPPRRHPNKITENAGIDYVRTVVHGSNCIYHQIDGSDDYGNDCFIEFFSNDVATSFTIGAQVKSGLSYKTARGYRIRANEEQLDYWATSFMPIAGIVYDIEDGCAYWIDISEYLRTHPEVLQQKYHNIPLSSAARFSKEGFDSFRNHFITAIQEYKDFENFGRSLEALAAFNDVQLCFGGMKSLFSNHRNKATAWLYLITTFEHIPFQRVQQDILGMLSNFLDNPDILWNSANEEYELYQTSDTRLEVLKYIEHNLTPGAVEHAIKFVSDGINRGSFSYLVFLILKRIARIDEIVLTLAKREGLPIEERHLLFWLYIHLAQHKDRPFVLSEISKFLTDFPDIDDDGMFAGIRDTLESEDFIQTG